MTILIVEDDLGLTRLIQKRLRGQFETQGLYRGEDTVAWLKDNQADLIILDYQLQDMTGKELISHLEGNRKKVPPFIIMTGHGDEKLAVEMMKMGARDYLVKDNNFLELLPSVVKQVMDQLVIEQSLAVARRALQESEEKYRTLFETMIQGVIYQDAEQERIISVNPAASRILGMSQEEMLNNRLEDLPVEFIREDGSTLREQEYPAHLALTKGGGVKNQIIGVLSQRGEGYSWISATAVPQFNLDTSKPEQVYTIFDDITRRKETEAKMASYTGEIELKNLELELAHNKIKEDIERARQLHQLFLPRDLPHVNQYSFAAHYQPAEKLGGDFYSLNPIDEDNVLICLADVTGHGLEGALLTVFIRETLNSYLYFHRASKKNISPKEVLSFLAAKYLQEGFPDDYFICVFIGIINSSTHQLSYSSGGIHIEPIYIAADGSMKSLDGSGSLISTVIPEELMIFTEHAITMEPGATVMFTTDGLVEEVVEGGMYGLEKVKHTLGQHHLFPPQVMIQEINDHFRSFVGTGQGRDDITYVILQRPNHEKELKLETWSDHEELDGVREEVASFCAGKGVDVDEIMIGLNEMLINCIEHGNKGIKTKKIKIRVLVAEKYVLLDMEDEGAGFNWQEKLACNLDLDDDGERGRGVMITKLCFDRMYYNPQGNMVTMIKNR